MVCSHPWEKLRPTSTPGMAHCQECNEDVECQHPRPLVCVGNELTHCIGCDRILESDLSSTIVTLSSQFLQQPVRAPGSAYPYH